MASTLRHISFRRLGGSDLHQRYLEDDRDLASFLGRRPRDVAELVRRAPTGAGRLLSREALARSFLDYARRHGAPDPVLQNAERLLDPNVHVVVTGQQPGLLGGPLFNLYKIATAIRLCQQIEAASGTRAVPVFWNHTDDHDLDEANRLFLVNQAQDVQRFRLELVHSGEPLRVIRCGRDVERLLQECDTLLPQSEYRAWTMALFQPRHPDETLGEAMARLMFALFGAQGLLVIEPRDLPPEAFAPLKRWWSQADSIREAVKQTCDDLSDVGIDVTMDPSATMMFEMAGGRRIPLAEGESHGNATDLSPGAMLRPLWQDACLPTIGFVVGPGELGYLAVVSRLYRILGVPQPPFVPRASLTLVEPSLRRLLSRFDWDITDLDVTPERLVQRLSGPDPGGAEDEVDALSGQLRTTLERVAQQVEKLDASMLTAVDRARSKALDELDKLAQKLRAARQNREGTGLRQIRRLCANLRPRGRLQERVLGPISFLVAHGMDLVEAILGAAEPFVAEHGVLEL